MDNLTRIASFSVDHDLITEGIYVSRIDGDVTTYDLRTRVPNNAECDYMSNLTMHSLEHLFAEHSRNHSDRVLDFSPMGCQTGFYLMLEGRWTDQEVQDLVAATLEDVLHATEVPAANEVQCGWGAHHTLTGAQDVARAFLAERDAWSTVTA